MATDSVGSSSKHENVYASAVSQVPEAIGDFAKQAWNNPLETALGLGKEAATSAALGAGLAYVLPAGGPASWAIGAAFTIPLVYKGIEGLVDAHNEAAKPGADVNAVGRKLADNAVDGAVNMGATFAGGWAGAEAGYRIADSDTTAGRFSKNLRTSVSDFENKGVVAAGQGWAFAKSIPESLSLKSTTLTSSDAAGMSPRAMATGTAPTDAGSVVSAAEHTPGKPLSVMNGMSYTERAITQLQNRLGQVTQTSDGLNGLTEYPALIHGHTALSDGDATPQSFVDRAKAAGYKVVLPSEHDHILARNGVEPTDERTGPESNTPIVGSDPQEEQAARDVAAAASVPGQFFADWGEELGVIGRLPPKMNADGTQVPRGANHTGLYGAEPYVRSGEPQPNNPVSGPVKHIVDSVKSAFGIKPADSKPISIEDIPDGQYEVLSKYLDDHPNPNNPVVAIFNHPRESQDFSPSTPANQQGHDYGMSRWPTIQDWLTNWGDKYGRGVEILKGGALTQTPIDILPPNFYDTQDAQILWDKGAHLGVSAGPDIHYQERIGQPKIATTILAKSLDRAGVYDALNARRMAVTSNFDKVTAYLTANDGKYVMGNILDQGTVGTAGLSPEVHIGGNVAPDANYIVNLWNDPKTGDGQLATIIQTKTLTGADLAKAGNTVTFDAVPHEAGNHSLIYAEVQRTDSTSPTYGKIMHTDERNPDGTPANVTQTPHGTFVKGISDQLETEEGIVTRDFADTPATPEVEFAANQDPNAPYPERAITSPIFIDPISGVNTTHSLFVRGITGANLAPANDEFKN